MQTLSGYQITILLILSAMFLQLLTLLILAYKTYRKFTAHKRPVMVSAPELNEVEEIKPARSRLTSDILREGLGLKTDYDSLADALNAIKLPAVVIAKNSNKIVMQDFNNKFFTIEDYLCGTMIVGSKITSKLPEHE